MLFCVLSTYLSATEKTFSIYPFPTDLPQSIEDELFEIRELGANNGTKKSPDDLIREKCKTLEAKLKSKIFCQDEPVTETANAILRFAAGVNDPTLPIACLLYCGPSGVGKTELAIQLCLELYGSKKPLARINMSEYAEAYSISRLIGSPPGYVGYESGGGLSNILLEQPYSVVLLDEIEKAHPKVLKLFLHIFDAGYFTSARGENVNCRKAIFILTTNLSSNKIADLYQEGLSPKQILEIVKPDLMEALSPEMYNRVDCMVFSPLPDNILEKLIKKLLDELRQRVLKAKEIEISFDQSLIDYLKTYQLDPKLGARPLKRVIEKELATVLAKAILDNQCKRGDIMLCSYKEGNLIIEVIFSEEN